ncbi:putative signal transduction protein with CBS domains [Methanococcus vannielii SB]|uniref:Signal transduction protein with CBS domains n=1 Tax=Methanococcus vannielii (strain ATCC 35089 / DSM 1224 / JCM 13029 / OCM 148 / SB) TaxID=406327 RepID=A6UN99_METVS|nr:CBS domain-containing protein [Methanococcus vannielii]ABR53971.1 putative signal transduction protein with CBS domains [Methanococcus vannielii SB]
MKNLESAISKYHSIKIKHILPPPKTMPVLCFDSKIMEVLEILKTRHHVWVIDCKEDGKLIGVIRYLDVINFLMPPEKHSMFIGNSKKAFVSAFSGAETAGDVMEKSAVTINHEKTVLESLEKMKNYNLQLLAVVNDENRLIGEISLRILINKFLELCF